MDEIRDFQNMEAFLSPDCVVQHIPASELVVVPKVEMLAKSVSAGGKSPPRVDARKKET